MMEELKQGAAKLGLALSPRQLEQFYLYYQELVDWNRRINLTAITDLREVQLKHFLDALTVTLAFPSQTALRIIDVGAGAGVPGLPLKIALPQMEVVLLEATAKKALFLKHIKEKLGLEGVEVVTGRAEEVAHRSPYREGFDLVLSRAVAPLPALVELTLPFCRVGGRVIAQKKGDIQDELAGAARGLSLLGGRLAGVEPVELGELADRRLLVVVEKVAPTPPAYPRRPGTPGKRPL